VDLVQVAAGAVLVVSPLEVRRSLRRVHDRIVARDGDPQRFERFMNARWLRAVLVVAVIGGLANVVLGLTT
jgi:hypothetical protein